MPNKTEEAPSKPGPAIEIPLGEVGNSTSKEAVLDGLRKIAPVLSMGPQIETLKSACATAEALTSPQLKEKYNGEMESRINDSLLALGLDVESVITPKEACEALGYGPKTAADVTPRQNAAICRNLQRDLAGERQELSQSESFLDTQQRFTALDVAALDRESAKAESWSCWLSPTCSTTGAMLEAARLDRNIEKQRSEQMKVEAEARESREEIAKIEKERQAYRCDNVSPKETPASGVAPKTELTQVGMHH